MDPNFTDPSDCDGIEIADPIENAHFELHTPTPVSPTRVSTDEFYFPVDSAVAIETGAIRLPKLMNVYVRTQSGDLVADNADHEDQSLASGGYTIELSTAPMKLYLSVESNIEITHDGRAVTLAFGDETIGGQTTVQIGARSFHDQPAGTITTTDDPVGAMRAMSYLGSALKTTSPERSFPTLRGHPPLVEVGESFEVPDGIECPDTGVLLELPAEYEYVYPAAPLAYYLGAEVVPADEPRLLTEEGFEYSLDGPLGYEETVGRVLRQTFFLDCVTRTEGYYQVDLHERNAVEDEIDLDFAELYEQSLAERLEAYLSVRFETIVDHVPDWNLTTDVMATAENVEVVPFVANDLALVRCPGTPSAASVSQTPEPLDEFFRNEPAGEGLTRGAIADGDFTRGAIADGDFTRGATADDDFTRGGTDTESPTDGGVEAADFARSTASGTATGPSKDEIFNPKPAKTVEHAWVGDGFPLGANKATIESYRRRVERSAPQKTSIEIHVVCNDERMKEEGVVEQLYGLRDLLQFDVSVHYELTTDELRDLLAEPADFLHYIGHVDDHGMRCPDGHLDARTLSDVNVKAFVLNACRSYEQGEALVESGSYGGVVTLAEVANSIATDTGRTLARLLNCGFSLRVALSIVKDTIATAYQYMTVGDGGLTLCQSESGTPLYLQVETISEDCFDLTISSYPVAEHGLGSFQQPHAGENTMKYLTSGELDTFELSAEELEEYLSLEIFPIERDGELVWSDEIYLDGL